MCIFQGSKVQTSTGETYIEDIRPGTEIQTRRGYLPAGGASSRKQTGCFTILTLSSNRQLIVTSDQPVMVINRGWTAARDVFSGDRVFTVSGLQTVVRLNYWKGQETVYGLPAGECYVEGVLCGDQ